jgi:hypothetical protein
MSQVLILAAVIMRNGNAIRASGFYYIYILLINL